MAANCANTGRDARNWAIWESKYDLQTFNFQMAFNGSAIDDIFSEIR